MRQEIKHRLDEQAYEKLRETIRENTRLNNLDETNIKTKKEAVKLVLTWIEKIYQIDSKEIEMDMDGQDIDNLFKEARNG